MTSLQPLTGHVVTPDAAPEVVAPPYDALTPAERAEHVETNPRSFLSVLPEAEYTTGRPLDEARQRLDQLITEDAFVPVDGPFVVVYRLRQGDHAQVGLVAGVPLDWLRHGRIRAHEDTRPERVEQIVRFLDEVGVASSPVSLAFPRHGRLVDALHRTTHDEPWVELRDGEVEQAIWVVTDPGPLLSAADEPLELYITDGHHRTAAALAHADRGGHDAPLLAVLFPADELRLVDYHRVVEDPPLDVEELTQALRDRDWELEPLPAPRHPAASGEFVVIAHERSLAVRMPSSDASDATERLDASRFQREVLGDVLGIEEVRSHPGLRFVPGDQGLEPLVAAVRGTESLAFVLHPPTMQEVMAVADAGQVMPPKSTYFTPKVRSGLLLQFRDGPSPAVSRPADCS